MRMPSRMPPRPPSRIWTTSLPGRPSLWHESPIITKGELVIDGLLVGEADVNVTVGGVEYHNFVGFGDVTDVVKINAAVGQPLSIQVNSSDAVSLTLYGLKNGKVTSIKSVKSKNNVATIENFTSRPRTVPNSSSASLPRTRRRAKPRTTTWNLQQRDLLRRLDQMNAAADLYIIIPVSKCFPLKRFGHSDKKI